MCPLTEADTRAKLIDPKLKLAGWGESQIEREHYFRKGVDLTRGRIYLVGRGARRGKPKRADYLLRYNGMPIAVLEAKEESRPPDEGLEQAKEYAALLDVPFAYSSNGHKFVEYDFLIHQSREFYHFPAPGSLSVRWNPPGWHMDRKLPKAAERPVEFGVRPAVNPLLHPYCPPERCGIRGPNTYFAKKGYYASETIDRLLPG